MRIGARIAGIAVGLLTCTSLTMQAQTFEWMLPYEQITPNVVGQKVQVTSGGAVFSQFHYWDIPPFYESGQVLEKYDPHGNRNWRLVWGGQGNYVDIRFTCGDDENFYLMHPYRKVAGEYADIKKMDQHGGLVWDTTLAGTYDNMEVTRDRIYLIGFPEDPADSYVAIGFTITQFDTLRQLMWKRDSVFTSGCVIRRAFTYADKEGNIFIVGIAESNERDIFYVKYDIDGNLVCHDWVHGPVGRTEEGFGITADDAGNFYLLSKVDGTDNINAAWITKYDPTGQEIWSKAFASEKNLGLQSIHTTSDGEIVVAGGYESQAQLVFRVDSSGTMQWRMPVDSVFKFISMAVGPDNALYFSNLNPGWKSYSGVRYLAKYSFHPVSVETLPDKEGLPTTCLLAQNYPNPFNPSTTIEFSIPSRGDVRLAVFDHLGREIAVLADGEYQAGTHSCQFPGAEHPSGVYMYHLNWNGNTVARRMALLR